MESLRSSRGLGPALPPYLDSLPPVLGVGKLRTGAELPHRGQRWNRRALRGPLSGPCPPSSRGPRVLTSRGQLQRWRRRAHMPPARRPLPTAPGVLSRPRGGERTGRRRRRGRGRRQRPLDTVTGVIPPPRPGEAKLSVTLAPRVTLPCWRTGRVPGSALRWGLGHG